MNKQELKAMCLIAKKLDWNGKPAVEIIHTIWGMVIMKRHNELSALGDCNSFEDTLLSLPLWDKESLLKLRKQYKDYSMEEACMARMDYQIC